LTEASLSEAVNRLNDQMQEAGMLDRFVTFGACVVDLNQHTLMVVNAGHLPPLIYRANTNAYEEGCSKDQTGFPLGIVEGTLYEGNIVTLAPGDCVVLFTDGISESRSKDEKEFGMPGVLAALNAGPMAPKAMGQRLVETVHRHATGRKPHDDLTVVTFGRLP
jgi:serine phosphatase RsbU (regulator of sigma subunit)